MKKLLFILTLFSLALASCSSEDNPSNKNINPIDRVDISLGRTKATADNLKNFYVNFTYDALKYVDSNAKVDSKNVVVSPFSAYIVLAMMANGANDDLRSKITSYLGSENIETINELANILISELPKVDNQIDLNIANSIWVDKNSSLSSEYTSIMQSDFQSQISYEDISNNSNKVLKTINKWCSNHTNGVIPSIIDELDRDTKAVLLNALYFNGIWHNNAFYPDDTQKMIFHSSKGDRTIDMMYSRYYERSFYRNDDFEAVSISFGNCAYSLMLILPNEEMSLSDSKEIIGSLSFNDILQESVRCDVEIFLPRFKIENKFKLNEIFASTEISDINYEQTYTMFSPSLPTQAKISQACSFEINETGAKVAAATSSVLVSGAAPIDPNKTYSLTFDRPFYFFLREISTGACILSGRIADL